MVSRGVDSGLKWNKREELVVMVFGVCVWGGVGGVVWCGAEMVRHLGIK